MLATIEQRIADDLGVHPHQVAAAVQLLDGGATVPFIARYRKEVTGNLDDTQLRTLEERLGYLRELEERRAAILASIEEQDKLTPELRAAVESAETKQRLEDLYLPYKLKRRTKAQIAREAGLEPLADALYNDPSLSPEAEAARFVAADKQVPDVKAALVGARQILMERFAEDAGLLEKLRNYLGEYVLVTSTVVAGKEEAGAKFRDWFDFREALKTVPSHRALAMFRGRNEDVLRLALKTEQELRDPPPGSSPNSSPCIAMIAGHVGIKDQGRAADKWLAETARWTWLVKLSLHFDAELMGALRERAEAEAIRVFARNLHDLLLAAPAAGGAFQKPFFFRIPFSAACITGDKCCKRDIFLRAGECLFQAHDLHGFYVCAVHVCRSSLAAENAPQFLKHVSEIAEPGEPVSRRTPTTERHLPKGVVLSAFLPV